MDAVINMWTEVLKRILKIRLVVCQIENLRPISGSVDRVWPLTSRYECSMSI